MLKLKRRTHPVFIEEDHLLLYSKKTTKLRRVLLFFVVLFCLNYAFIWFFCFYQRILRTFSESERINQYLVKNGIDPSKDEEVRFVTFMLIEMFRWTKT